MRFNFKRKKSFDYLENFVTLSAFSLQTAEFLNAALRDYQVENSSELKTKMHEIEHLADIAKHDMLKVLIKEFLPPFDRDDIISLSHNIDEVTDAVEDVLICFDMLHISEVHQEVLVFTELIVECCKHMNMAVAELKNYKKSVTLFDELDEVNHIKSKGEALYVNSLRTLYQITEDPVHIFGYTEIYKRLEKCCQKCKIVTNDIQRIVMKNL